MLWLIWEYAANHLTGHKTCHRYFLGNVHRSHTSLNFTGCVVWGLVRPDNTAMLPMSSPIKDTSCHLSGEQDKNVGRWPIVCMCACVCAGLSAGLVIFHRSPLSLVAKWASTKADYRWGKLPQAQNVYGLGRAPEPWRVLDGKFHPVLFSCWYYTAC